MAAIIIELINCWGFAVTIAYNGKEIFILKIINKTVNIIVAKCIFFFEYIS